MDWLSRAWLLSLSLMCAVAPRALRADTRADGITVVLCGPAEDQPTPFGDTPGALSSLVVEKLRPVVRGAVAAAGAPLPWEPLFADLRRLPKELRERVDQDPARFATRYLLCLRMVRSEGGTLIGEAAVVDINESVLLGFTTMSVAAAALSEELPGTVADLVGATLPIAKRQVTHPAPREVAADSSLVPESVGAVATSGTAAVRDAPSPVVADAVIRPAPAPAPHPLGERPPATPGVAVDFDSLLNRYALAAAAAAGLGRPAGPPELKEAAYEIPLGVGTGSDDPVTAGITLYSAGDRMRVEALFSGRVELGQPERRGNWVAIDLAGRRPDREHVVEVGRSGLLSVHVKPLGEQARTRIGFHLTDAGDLDIETAADGRSFVATAFKDAERVQWGRIVNPRRPFEGGFRVKRTFTGVTSWYGGRAHGGPTASGERYNQWGWTAAHKTLPMGTWIRVTNPRNGKSAVLRINDRGPYIRGRSLDVTVACARALGFYNQGVCRLKIEILERE